HHYPEARTHSGPGPADAPGPDTDGIFGEREPGRAPIGGLTMPVGQYCVKLNLTEESFHANMDEERSLPGGGFWAWVLESDLRFEVRAPLSRASCSGCLPGPHEGLTALWRRRS
ncbi:MAG: hypothetical protein AB7Y46_20140, partial [Armatimonadota bacterium]